MVLVDYDVSSNWANWQYVAGVGNDPRGEARIFNPVKQAFEYDNHGDYVKTWVPEVKSVEKLENIFQVCTTSPGDLEKYGLTGNIMATDPVHRIEFVVDGKPKTNKRTYQRRGKPGRGPPHGESSSGSPGPIGGYRGQSSSRGHGGYGGQRTRSNGGSYGSRAYSGNFYHAQSGYAHSFFAGPPGQHSHMAMGYHNGPGYTMNGLGPGGQHQPPPSYMMLHPVYPQPHPQPYSQPRPQSHLQQPPQPPQT